MMVIDNGNSIEDMLIEILAKLQVKSLLRLRCVCKSWYSLIKDPIFIDKHLNNDNNTRLIVTYCKGVEKEDETEGDIQEAVYPKEFFGLYTDETLEDLSLKDLDAQKPLVGSLWGPYSGIFCIIGITNLVTLWNLATQESRTLPKRRATLSQYTDAHSTDVGFGLDLMTNDYKLVLIMTFWDEKQDLLCDFSHVAVYTLGTNLWREFECFKSFHYHMPLSGDSVYWDGVCYWLLDLKNDNHYLILSFHMGEEDFQEIQGPHISKSAANVTLGIHNESLSLLLFDTINHCFEAWELKNRNWIKQFTVGHYVGFYKPLKFWKKGSFLVEFNTSQLLLYEPSTGDMRDFELECYWFAVEIYNESLITMKGGDNLLEE